MNLTSKQTIQISAYILLILVFTQAFYTGLYIAGVEVPRQFLWGFEAVLFSILAVFAGAALVQAKNYHLGWSAIAFGAVLNVIQVSIGLTMFGPFQEAAGQIDGLGSVAGAVVALSFMIYYAAKLLLGFAALVFGMASMAGDAKVLGKVATAVGGIAVLANAILIIFGREAFLPSPVAGGTGVLATLLLALCLMNIAREK